MHALLISAGLVALAEIGDRTQILAVLLAARYRRSVPILAGIFAATVAIHVASVAVGVLIGDFLRGPWMKWIIGGAFLIFAAWTLAPEKLSDEDEPKAVGHGSVFLTTFVAFFLAEIGDKTQIVAMALGARFKDVFWVATGTTIGMMLANVPAVFVGEMAATRLPVKPMRYIAAAALAAQGAWTLLAPG